MKNEKRSKENGSDKSIITTASFLFGALVYATVSGWNRRKKVVKQDTARAADQWVDTLPGTDPHNSSTFYELRLSKNDYEALRQIGGSTLVFQFYYPKESNCGSPTLYAYNMKTGHVATGGRPAILNYGLASKEPLKGRNQVLGDQQVEVRKLENLIKLSPGGKKREFSNFVFKPRYIPDNPHIAYDITVDGQGASEMANPSPPG